jgi:hypothetical protein
MHRTQKSIRIRGQIQKKSLLPIVTFERYSFCGLSPYHQNLSLRIHQKVIWTSTAAFSFNPFI